LPRSGDSEVICLRLRVKLPHVTVSLTTKLSLSALPKDARSELADLSSHYPFLMLIVKQECFEYSRLKSFGLTRSGNRTHVYRLRGGWSNH